MELKKNPKEISQEIAVYFFVGGFGLVNVSVLGKPWSTKI